MIYNSKIKVSGKKEDIYLPKEKAEKIKIIWNDSTIDNSFVIHSDKISFRKGDIRFVEILNDLASSSDNQFHQHVQKQNEDYIKERNTFLRQTPEEKAMNFDWFKIVWASFGGKEEDFGDYEYLKQIQYNFFKNNPRRMLADTELFKPLLKTMKGNYFFVDMLARILNQDIQLA